MKNQKTEHKIPKIRCNKGITLISLVITIALMLIIIGVTVNVSYERFGLNKLKKLFNDLELLSDKVANYYLKYNGLPLLRDDNGDVTKYIFNDKDWYVIDLAAIGDISLNYGKEGYENLNASNDVYVIEPSTRAIYYAKGIEFRGNTYNTLAEMTSNLEDFIDPTKPEIKVISGETKEIGEKTYYISDIYIEIIPGKDNWSGIDGTECTINDENYDLTRTNNIIHITENGTYNIKVTSYDKKNNSSVSGLTIEKLENSITLSNEKIVDGKIELGKVRYEDITEYITAELIYGDYNNIQWESSKPDIAEIEKTEGGKVGKVTIKDIGTVEIIATYEEYSAKCIIEITELPYIELSDTKISVDFTHGETYTFDLTATLYNAPDGRLAWISSDPTMVSIGETGEIEGNEETRTITVLKAMEDVTTDVTITVSYGEYKKECVVSITELPYISLDKNVITRVVENKETEEVTLTASLHNATGDLTWTSSDSSIAAISGSGNERTIILKNSGVATITVSYGDYEAKCTINVMFMPYITLDTTEVTLKIEKTAETKNITATLHNATGDLTWTSSNTSVATISESGNTRTITAVDDGETTITVSYGEYKSECKVKVEKIPYITLDKTSITETVEKAESKDVTLTATLHNATGDLTWASSEEDIATVSGAGNIGTITLKKTGTATITVSYGEYKAECIVDVTMVPYITLDKDLISETIENAESKDVTLTATLHNATGDLDWTSSNTSVASIVGSGNTRTISLKSSGTSKITVSYGEYKAECTVNVTMVPYITLDKNSITETVENAESKDVTLTATLHNATGTLTWVSSDSGIASISGSGNTRTITLKKTGTATITVSYGEYKAECKVNVTMVPYITLDTTEVTLKIEKTAETKNITATLHNATGTLTWASSNTSVATISGTGNTGTITAKDAGETTITVSYGEYKAECLVKVEKIPYIELSTYSISKTVENAESGTVSLTASLYNATGDLTWTSSDSSIAEISGSGTTRTITVKKTGIATITVSYGEYKAECIVDVTMVPYITLDKTEFSRVIEGSLEVPLTATLHNATGDLTWESSNTAVATISGTGNTRTITLLSNGTATITVSYLGYIAECKITVIEPYIVLDKLGISEVVENAESKDVTLTATLYHATGTLNWSSNSDIVSLSKETSSSRRNNNYNIKENWYNNNNSKLWSILCRVLS